MARYYFDSRDNGSFMHDDLGGDYPDLEAVKAEAAKALVELARDVLPGSTKRELAIEVRDETGSVLTSRMTFQAMVLRPD